MSQPNPTRSIVGSQRILLIGGAMRSGTTVIHRALCTARNSNPYISESWFLHDIMNLYKWNLSRYEVRSADQFGSPRNFMTLIRMNLQYYLSMVSARHDDPDVLILKHPELTRHFIDIGAMFPGMLFMAIVRDPRDVIASIKTVREKHWKDGVVSPISQLKDMGAMCRHYASYYNPIMGPGDALKGRLKFIRYEDMMRDPKSVVEGIGAFCGADYDLDSVPAFNDQHAASSNFNKELRLKDPLSGAFWSDLYTKSLSDERIGKFGDVLDAEEVTAVESMLRPVGSRFGYW